jgi:hypothetical protein
LWIIKKNNAFGVPYPKVFTENRYFAPLPGQTGPNPLRYNALNNPFDTDSTFHLVDSTGKITFAAQSVMEPILSYTIKEYRNNILMGEMYCINQFTIRPDGRLPSFIRVDTANVQNAYFNNEGTFISAPGLPISFEAYIKLPGVPTGNLVVRTTADTTIPGNGNCNITGLNTDSVHLNFSWTPPANTKGLYNVFVYAKDSNCSPPYNHYQQVYTWSFYIDSSLSPTSFNTIEKDNFISIYPNPAMQEVLVSSTANFSSLKVYSLLSTCLIDQKFSSTRSKHFDVGHLTNGIYLVIVDGDLLRNRGNKIIFGTSVCTFNAQPGDY